MYKGEKTVTIFLKDKNFFFVHGVKCILTEFLSKEGMHVVFEDTLDNIKKCQVAIIGMSFFLNYKLGMVSDYNLPTIFWMETADEKSIGYVRGYTLSFQVPVNDFLSQVKNINANKNPGSKKRVKDKRKLTQIESKVMRYYVEGVNNKVSAEKLGINGKTLSRYKRNAMVKLNINNNRDFFRWLPKSYDYGNNGDCFI